MSKKRKASETKKKESTRSTKAPKRKQEAVNTPKENEETGTQEPIAVVTETPMPVEAAEPEDNQVQEQRQETPDTSQGTEEAETQEPVAAAAEAQEPVAAVAETPVPAEAAEPEDNPVEAEAIDEDIPPALPEKKRVLSILNVETDDEATVSVQNVSKYLDCLKGEMDLPCRVTGSRVFGWEKLFAWDLRNKGRYEELKETSPSHTDEFEMTGFDDDFDEIDGIVAHVSRVSDKKGFLLPLIDLKALEEGSKNADLLEEYRDWFITYR